MGTVDVLQVITSATPRGAERYAVMLEPELVERGLRTRTVALHAGPGPALDVSILGSSKLGPATLRVLRRACGNAGVVLAHGSATLPAVALATVGLGVPFVYRNIGDPYFWATTRRRRWQTRLLLSRSADVAALTPEAGRRMTACYATAPDRIVVIPNGVPVADFPRRDADAQRAARAALSIPPDRQVAVCLGALSPEKDVASAVRAVLELPDRWMLLVGGDGRQRSEIERVAEPGGDRVRLLGHVERPLEVLRAADVLLLSSLTEGLPGVIIEAAMVGVPTVATDAGFIRDLIEDDVTGFVVPVSDPSAMARAVLRIEPDLERLGRAAHERAVGSYSMAATADQWRAVLRRHIDRLEPASPRDAA